MYILQKAVGLFACLTVAIIGVSPAVEAAELVTVKPAHGGKLIFVLLKPNNPKATVILFPGGRGYLRLNRHGKIRKRGVRAGLGGQI